MAQNPRSRKRSVRAARPRALMVCCALLAIAVLAQAARAQSGVEVRGRVQDRRTHDAVPGATVDLLGGSVVQTAADGGFRLSGVRPGRQTLVVDALGYKPVEVALLLRADTTVLIQLDPSPVRLDTITVHKRNITVRGTVDDALGRQVPDADVDAGRTHTAVTNAAGGFRLRGVPWGHSVTVSVRALGFLPAHVTFLAESDTTLRFRLSADPVGQRMIALQDEQLEVRSRGQPYARTEFDREALLERSNWSAYDIIADRLGTRDLHAQCVFIDETEKSFGLDELKTMYPDELQRIEIIDKGTMIRVYTRLYIQRMLQHRVTLGTLLLIKGGLGKPLCR